MQIDIETNRAFRYGDGLFETIIYKNNQLQHWKLHENRLQKSCKIMQFEANFLFENNFLYHQILAKLTLMQPFEKKRIRLQLWRKDGGLYTPITNEIEYAISITDFVEMPDNQSIAIGIAKDICLNYSAISMLKTTNALPYILAGLEKKARNLDDILLLDSQGNVSEGSSSNVFWESKNQIYTPSLDCGCIAGVTRKFILQSAKNKNITIIEGKFKVQDLKNADTIIFTNVASIKKINCLDDLTFKNNGNILSKIVPIL